MKKILAWLKESNRWKHLLGGVAIGAFADSTYCAFYAGAGVGAAMEIKDSLYGNRFDVIDMALTTAGAGVGRLIRIALCQLL